MKRCIALLLLSFAAGCLSFDGEDEVRVDDDGQELISYNYLAAAQYARRYAIQGGVGQNLSYPDLRPDDCTNFVSQAVAAGGVPMVGASGPCGYLQTTTQWYAVKVPACTANPPGFALSTSWARVKEFWTYHTTHGAVGASYSSSQLSTLRSRAQLGDIVQAARFGSWSHSMIVTAKSANEIYLTYHSSHAGTDVVDNPLGTFASDPSYTNYRLLSFYHSIQP